MVRNLSAIAIAATIAAATNASCPDLMPADDGTDLPTPLVISEINPGEYLELFNPGDTDVDLFEENLWLCSPFLYASLAEVAPDVVVPAGGYATVPMPANFEDTDAGGEIILYRDIFLPFDFADSTLIVDFVCWGVNPHFSRKGQAEKVGKWSGDCAPPLARGAIHRVASTGGTGAGDYSVVDAPSPSDCVPDDDPVPGDVTGDGLVDVSDLLAVIIAFGICPEGDACPADLDGDGEVTANDLVIVVTNWS
jgi:hypothetical protein